MTALILPTPPERSPFACTFRAGLSERLHSETGFATAWALQARLAGLALLAAVAFFSVWLALAATLGWSLIATSAYFHIREGGAPDLLEIQFRRGATGSRGNCGSALYCAFRVLLIGPPAFVFAKLAALTMNRSACKGVRSWLSPAALVVGLTLFGVTSTHHLLQHAGYRGSNLLHLSYGGSLLNVGYRVVIGALIINAITYIVSLLNVRALV